jgi:hypothetical protein
MAFISEIHYLSNFSVPSGFDEYVEIALSPTDFARANDFEFAAYQSDGAASLTVNLGTLTPVIDPDNGYYIYTISVNVTDPDHAAGDPASEAEAVALVDNSLASPVVSFFDIGGGTTNITAVDGPALGAISTNINGVALNETSIQFSIDGTRLDGALTPDSAVVCLEETASIKTEQGDRAIKDLKVGEFVFVGDDRIEQIQWIGSRELSFLDLQRNQKMYPIRISAGALGRGLPVRDLLVSRQHRLLVDSKIAERMFGRSEVLVAAIRLVGLPGVFIDKTVTKITYFHMLFKQHEIVYAEGAPTESLFTGAEALKMVPPEARSEIIEALPEIIEPNFKPISARTIPSPKFQKKLVKRHLKNNIPIISSEPAKRLLEAC